MNKLLLIVFVSLTTIVSEGCDMEDKYVHVCEGKYGSDQVIDLLKQRYGISNAFVFGQWYKEKFAPRNPSCDTIELQIQADSLPFRYNDTFAISVAKIFFNDSSNIHIKSLVLKIKDLWPMIGGANVSFTVDRVDLQKNYLANQLIDTTDMEFSIKHESPYTASTGSENWKGMKIFVEVPKDYINIEKVAGKLKNQYNSVIIEKELSEFDIDITIKSPLDKLCTSKTYHFFYHKSNKNL